MRSLFAIALIGVASGSSGCANAPPPTASLCGQALVARQEGELFFDRDSDPKNSIYPTLFVWNSSIEPAPLGELLQLDGLRISPSSDEDADSMREIGSIPISASCLISVFLATDGALSREETGSTQWAYVMWEDRIVATG